MNGEVISVNCSPTHSLIKPNQEQVRLLAGLGVEGDAHAGTTVKHRSRVARNPDQPNLRQVHLIHSELYAELREAGFDVSHGQMGENITTGGVDLLGLPTGALLRIRDAVVEITGLRNPCAQLNKIQPGLLDSVLGHDEDGNLIRKAGIMGIVVTGGEVMADKIRLGIIGANIHRGWAVRSHLPAVVASPEFELTAVCTTRMESAEESRQKFGARLAFNDYRKMLDHPDIDAVAVSLRVPAHYEPTMDALNGGKHVYTEWPLGRTTAEAVEMADLARERVSATWWDSSPEPTRCCFTSRTLWLRATWAR